MLLAFWIAVQRRGHQSHQHPDLGGVPVLRATALTLAMVLGPTNELPKCPYCVKDPIFVDRTCTRVHGGKK